MHKNDHPEARWWKEAVIYQIYPRSFNDSNGDGIGDLNGITEKLDYIQSLGIDVVWINPVYSSPNDDNGYDISDYRNIMAEFGSMEDFDTMLRGMHERGIKLVMDLVVNHSSDEHKWFREARSSRENPYRDYYHWWPAEKGTPPERFSYFDEDNDAWQYDAQTDAWYLHYFTKKQPDLKWENPQVRREIYDMMHYWFKKGIDGFRMDVITHISKDTSYPEISEEELEEKYHGDWPFYYAHGPRIHEFMREMNREVLSKYDVMSLGEGSGTTSEDAPLYTDPQRKELNMFYHFDGMNIGYLPEKYKTVNPDGFDLLEFKQIYTKWDKAFNTKGWGTIYLGNHDQPRMVTRWGNDSPEFRTLSSKMLTTFLMTMRATPCYYYGDEIGMCNIKFNAIDDYRDVETRNMYSQIKKKNGDLEEFIESQKISARDNGRTPFQWDDNNNAGFTTGTPWIRVNPDYTSFNAAAQENDPDSCLHYFRAMVKFRKAHPVLVYGDYQLIDEKNPNVYAYTRTDHRESLLILLNFSDRNSTVDLSEIDTRNVSLLLSNFPGKAKNLQSLKPYEAAVYCI